MRLVAARYSKISKNTMSSLTRVVATFLLVFFASSAEAGFWEGQKRKPLLPKEGRSLDLSQRYMGRVIRPEHNQTKKLHALYEASSKSKVSTLPADAQRYRYIIVGGAFTRAYPRYFSHGIKHLRGNNLDVIEAKVPLMGTVEENSLAIQALIEDQAKQGFKVVLIGHSKGGVDIAAALGQRPELSKHVRAVLTIQSPLKGYVKTVGGHWSERLLPGAKRTLSGLTFEKRSESLQDNPFPQTVPTFAFVSSTKVFHPVIKPFAPLKKSRVANDGFVPLDSQVLPGMSYAEFEGIDHASSVWKLPGNKQVDQASLLMSLVSATLALPDNRQAHR